MVSIFYITWYEKVWLATKSPMIKCLVTTKSPMKKCSNYIYWCQKNLDGIRQFLSILCQIIEVVVQNHKFDLNENFC